MFKPFRFVLTVALLLVSALPLHAQAPDAQGNLAERLSYHVHLLAADSLEGRPPGSRGSEIAMNYIAAHFETFGLQPFENGSHFQPFQLRHASVNLNATNVIGIVEGHDPQLRNEVIVIGAHYDHIGFNPGREGVERVYSGADDNASGTAMMMELARYFAENPEKTARTLLFIAFDAEEIGLRGAYHFVRNHGFDSTNNLRLMFSLDMVGMYEAYNGVDLKGIGSLAGGRSIAVPVSEQHGVRLKNTSADIEPRTDTWPFGEAGIPAVHVFTGLKSPYHQPQDTADLLDYEGMARITTYMKDLLTELSVQTALEPAPRFVRAVSPRGVRTDVGVLLSLGVSRHRYPDAFFAAGNAQFSAGAGLFAQLHFGHSFVLQPELFYDFNGSETEAGRFSRHSVSLPVNVQYNLVNEAGGLLRLYPSAGLYGRYSFAGKVAGEDLDLGGVHRDLEWGLNLGGGLQIYSFNIGYSWRRAFNTVSTDGLNSFAASNTLTVGYRF
ncbi:Outer membrane protein beta-barrel domain-containing protein [Cyclonatronum proteinivorum]|uniref:Outer membrane protein beta-barrel domain-containing protein n=1 Tax=Cyclonatronum proteinivorum TaxID=1457365 RepID=A0A345UG64_9BACT|nr:M20/M25/M40 family metallo-hydrolase [Cyclonatronum proteinivorum]AXI99465.1 Outer membrane protein beta-barrel domain-containing protein [Cyclonatronum proteinivorum]